MNSQEQNTQLQRPRFLLTLTATFIPAVLSANHGLEALGMVIAFAAAFIGVVVCLIPTLVFLFRKKPATWASYVLIVLNFGIGIFFFAIADEMDEGIVVWAGSALMVLGMLVVIKSIRSQNDN